MTKAKPKDHELRKRVAQDVEPVLDWTVEKLKELTELPDTFADNADKSALFRANSLLRFIAVLNGLVKLNDEAQPEPKAEPKRVGPKPRVPVKRDEAESEEPKSEPKTNVAPFSHYRDLVAKASAKAAALGSKSE